MSSFIDVDTGNYTNYDFLADKRPPQINRSFEEENPRGKIFTWSLFKEQLEGSSKLCKLEYEEPDGSATFLNMREKNQNETSGLIKTPLFDRLSREEKLVDISSPMRIEEEFEMLSFQQKDHGDLMEYDFLTGSNLF